MYYPLLSFAPKYNLKKNKKTGCFVCIRKTSFLDTVLSCLSKSPSSETHSLERLKKVGNM